MSRGAGNGKRGDNHFHRPPFDHVDHCTRPVRAHIVCQPEEPLHYLRFVKPVSSIGMNGVEISIASCDNLSLITFVASSRRSASPTILSVVMPPIATARPLKGMFQHSLSHLVQD